MKRPITFCVYDVNNFIYNSILYALPYFQDYLTLPPTSSNTAICYPLHKSSFRTLMEALRCRSHTHPPTLPHSPHVIPHLDAGSVRTHITTLHLATLLPQDSASKRGITGLGVNAWENAFSISIHKLCHVIPHPDTGSSTMQKSLHNP